MVWTRNVDGSQRLVACLVTLMDETDRLFPGRSTASDGSIGNAAHQGQANPDNSFGTEHVADNSGDVRAVDITHDPAAGCDVDRLASALIARQDPRVLYLIRNQRIISSYRAGTVPAWTWRPYVGDPHDHHLHLSTPDDPFTKADTSPWWPTAAAPPVPQEDDDMNLSAVTGADGVRRVFMRGTDDALYMAVESPGQPFVKDQFESLGGKVTSLIAASDARGVYVACRGIDGSLYLIEQQAGGGFVKDSFVPLGGKIAS